MTLENPTNKCIIIFAINAYGMSINNLDIRLVIEWNCSTTLNNKSYKLSQVDRNDYSSIFILIYLK